MASAQETNPVGPSDPQQGPARLFGVILVTVGLADYAGIGVTDGRFLGVFRLSEGVNLVYVMTGLLGVVLSRYAGAGTLFNKLGGVIYSVVFLVGALQSISGTKGANWASNGLHLLLAIVVGTVGFGTGRNRPC